MNRLDRLVAALIGATLVIGLLSVRELGNQPAYRSGAPAAMCPCMPADQGSRRSTPTPSSGPAKQRPAPSAVPRPKGSPRARVTPRPTAPARQPALHRLLLRRVAGVAPATVAAVDAMHLTVAGYRSFLKHIDRTYYGDAQRFIEFDPHRVPISQGRSEIFIWHFTAFYRNADGPSQTPKGEMSLPPFIAGMALRGDDSSPPDHVCCGINWVIDRFGPAHQLAPVNAKLRHNPPYDSINTGVEVEAARQVDLTTAQYETTAYLTIAVLTQQHLLGRKPLSEIVKGHGEMRDAYLIEHPDSRYGTRDDFNEPESRLLRQVIQRFVHAHPVVLRLTPHLR